MKSPLIHYAVVILLAFFSANYEIQEQSLRAEIRDELLEKARQWKVPQPATEAELFKIKAYQSGATDYFALGFIDPEKPEQALVGFDHWQIKEKWGVAQKVLNPEELSLADIVSSGGSTGAQKTNHGLVTGIQLLRRGNLKLGSALIKKSLGAEAGHHRSPFLSPAGEEPILMLARNCLAAAVNEISNPEPDFASIQQRIEMLLADQPNLKSSRLDWILESLEASVAHKCGAPGTIERVIDDYLLNVGAKDKQSLSDGFPPATRALILKGFEAVPALLEQRHSKRLTSHLRQGFNNFPSSPMTAAQVIDDYLQQLANAEFGSDWLERQNGRTASDDAVLAWWKKASAMGEDAYIKKHIVGVRTDQKGDYLGSALLLLARERYPAILPEIYQTILKTSAISWDATEAVAESRVISNERKIELLEDAIATNSEAHRNAALRSLRNLDPELADRKLLQLLKKAPNTAKEAYWTDQDANLGRFVSVSSNPEVWKAFHALLERADLGMRMELIDHLNPPDNASYEILSSFYRVYDQFREDKTIRDHSASQKFSGPGAAFSHKKIEMRDFIHEHWAGWLKLDIAYPQQGASSAKWQEYRNQVSSAIKRHREEHGLQPKRN